jgi:hypothetical protein
MMLMLLLTELVRLEVRLFVEAESLGTLTGHHESGVSSADGGGRTSAHAYPRLAA